jgi:hypothetical protein
MLSLATSIEELARELAASLRDAERGRTRNRIFRDHFLRPAGADVAASPKLVEEVERLPSMSKVDPERSPAPLRLAGRLLALAVRAAARRERDRAELALIGSKQWREELA